MALQMPQRRMGRVDPFKCVVEAHEAEVQGVAQISETGMLVAEVDKLRSSQREDIVPGREGIRDRRLVGGISQRDIECSDSLGAAENQRLRSALAEALRANRDLSTPAWRPRRAGAGRRISDHQALIQTRVNDRVRNAKDLVRLMIHPMGSR